MSEAIGGATIDETIQQVEMLYRSVTGRDAPPAETAYAPIPAEKDPTRHVEEQMDRLLGLLGQNEIQPAQAPTWTPPMVVTESDTELVICLDLPGVGRDRVQLRQQGELLTVSGERPLPGNGGARLRMSERPLGAFRRTLWIPTRPAELTAQMKEGVLEIRVRKEVKAEPQAKTIEVS
jgi:HSP20 family protein